MAPNPVDPHVDLEHYRVPDQTESVNVDGELMPERETLNTRFVSEFLNQRGITAENFKDKFTLATAIDLTSEKHSRGEAEMFNVLTKTKSFLDKEGIGPILETSDPKVAYSNIHFELSKRPAISHNEAHLKRGYDTYYSIRSRIDKMFRIQDKFGKDRQKEKTILDASVKTDFAEALNDAKKNYSKLDSKERIGLVVGGLIGAAMLYMSDSPRVGKIRETIWTCCKIGAVGWTGNTLFKILTGKGLLDSVSDWSKSTAEKDGFMAKAFHVPPDRGELLGKASIYLGDLDFMRVAKDYKRARDLGKDEIEFPTVSKRDMSSKDNFTALHDFFSKNEHYSVEKLMKKYANAKPRATFREVLGTALIDDNTIEMEGGLVERTGTAVSGAVTRVYNGVAPKIDAAVDALDKGKLEKGLEKVGKTVGGVAGAVGKGIGKGTGAIIKGVVPGAGAIVRGSAEGIGAAATSLIEGGVEGAKDIGAWAKEMYYKNFGEYGSKEDVNKFMSKQMSQCYPAELENTIRELNPQRRVKDGFIQASFHGTPARVLDSDIQYVKKAGDSIYVIASTKTPHIMDNPQIVLETIQKSMAAAREFLKREYPQEVGDNVDKFMKRHYGTYVIGKGYEVGVRMSLPGTNEFEQRRLGKWTKKDMDDAEGIEIFGRNNKFDLNKLGGNGDERINLLCLRFHLDKKTQRAELEAVCNKLTSLYNKKDDSMDKVNNEVFKVFSKGETDPLLEEVLSTLRAGNFKQNLLKNQPILENCESDILSLEKDVASTVIGTDDVKKKFEEEHRNREGVVVRLAILGDTDAMGKCNYDPRDNTKTHTVDDLLKKYRGDLEAQVKLNNNGEVPKKRLIFF